MNEMKKEYNKPALKVYKVHLHTPIAASMAVGNGETGEQNALFFREDEWDWE